VPLKQQLYSHLLQWTFILHLEESSGENGGLQALLVLNEEPDDEGL